MTDSSHRDATGSDRDLHVNWIIIDATYLVRDRSAPLEGQVKLFADEGGIAGLTGELARVDERASHEITVLAQAVVCTDTAGLMAWKYRQLVAKARGERMLRQIEQRAAQDELDRPEHPEPWKAGFVSALIAARRAELEAGFANASAEQFYAEADAILLEAGRTLSREQQPMLIGSTAGTDERPPRSITEMVALSRPDGP